MTAIRTLPLVGVEDIVTVKEVDVEAVLAGP
jgi:hypothetical protein